MLGCASQSGARMTLILSNDDVEKLLTMPECIDVMEEAYIELAEGRGISRTRSDCFAPTTRPDALYSLKSMDGVVPKLGVGAVRINSDIITWPKRGNNMRREKVPAAPNNRYVGLVLLFSVETGEPLAILPDGVMQRIRVGAANGLGIKYLARKNARTVGILGSGWQAGAQLMAACAVRDIETIRCFSPNPENRDTFAATMSALLGVEVDPVAEPEAAIKGADIVMCATQLDRSYFLRALDRAWNALELHQTAGDRGEGDQARRPRGHPLERPGPHPRRGQGRGDRGEGGGPGLAARRGDRLQAASDLAGARDRPGRRAQIRQPTSRASSTISGSASSSPRPARSSTARPRRAASATRCRPTGSPRTCIHEVAATIPDVLACSIGVLELARGAA